MPLIVLLKVAAPAADISRVRAVMPEPPSLPLNNMSLSWTVASIEKSLELLLNLPISVPPSLKLISPPSESRLIPPATSIVKSPLDKSISVPSIVMLSTAIPPSAVNTPATFKSVKASTIAAPEPAPSEYMAFTWLLGIVMLAPLPCEIIIL